MRKALMMAGVAIAAVALTVGMCACGNKAQSATGTGTGDNSALLISELQQAGTQTFETVTFGTYEQDGNTANGAEPIEWYVLDKQDGKVLLISKYILDAVPYDDAYVGYPWGMTNPRPVTDTVWADCSLRSWLNGAFINGAFTKDEQGKIIAYTSSDTKVFGTTTAANSPSADAHVTAAVTDKVFLLSSWEAKTLFNNDDARMATATQYAKAQGVYVNKDTASDETTVGYSPWWTRTVGYYAGYAAVVMPDGYVHGAGYRQDGENHDGGTNHGNYASELGGNFGVRPCVWVDASVLG